MHSHAWTLPKHSPSAERTPIATAASLDRECFTFSEAISARDIDVILPADGVSEGLVSSVRTLTSRTPWVFCVTDTAPLSHSNSHVIDANNAFPPVCP